MDVKEIKTKSCMTKSKLTDYVINPYTGCSHGCAYCYADFIRRFQNIPDKWGDFVYVKMNCPELLEKELVVNKPGHIWMSSVCDCYMPLEGKYKLTRQILEVILNSLYKKKFSMEILTKSALVRRDLDLLKKLNSEIDFELGVSINTLDEKYSRIIEPFASPPRERIKVLKEANENGIKVFGFISPVILGITNLDGLFKELSFCEYVWVELLNIKPSVVKRLKPVVEKNFPDKIKDFEFMLDHYEEYVLGVRKEVKKLSKEYNLKIKGVVVH